MSNKELLTQEIEKIADLVNFYDRGAVDWFLMFKAFPFFAELHNKEAALKSAYDYLTGDILYALNKPLPSKKETVDMLSTFLERVDKETEISCFQHIFKSCSNCGCSCANDDGVVCDEWIPRRVAHQNTPNPCELKSISDYDLCLDVCKYCEHCPKD